MKSQVISHKLQPSLRGLDIFMSRPKQSLFGIAEPVPSPSLGLLRRPLRGLLAMTGRGISFGLLAMTLICQAHAEPTYIDHFEKTANLLGGRTSVYQQAPSRAIAVTTDREHYGAGMRSLAIRYDKQNAGGPYDSGGWCGYYSILKFGPKYFDATKFTRLTFWVKGEKGDENFKVGMADRHWEQVDDSVKSEDIAVYLKDKKITTEWQQAVIPLDVFFIDMKELASLAICFEGDCFPNGKGAGTVYIDELAFE